MIKPVDSIQITQSSKGSQFQPSAGKSFGEALNLADIQADLQKFETKIKSGQAMSPQELIMLQIRAGRYGMAVELVSKIADGALAIVRKFQNQQ